MDVDKLTTLVKDIYNELLLKESIKKPLLFSEIRLEPI